MKTTRQKSENAVVPHARGNPGSTRVASATGGGKGVPVQEVTQQLMMAFMTAESPRGAAGGAGSDLSAPVPRKAPKMEVNLGSAGSATMEEVVRNLKGAFEKVAANRGAPGPDGKSVREVRDHLPQVISELGPALLAGRYTPGDIRRVWIPKPGGGERGLGIPNVVDRMVQEAVRRVIEPLYEPHFHPSSHGFRPGRSCQTAIAEAQRHTEEGHGWVVDIDLEKFFDRVHHQRLMARLAERISDRRLLILLGQMLKAGVVLPEGVRVSNDEGVPQGGPLSPLLSNIVLYELDRELDRRGLHFVRYADDCNIYVSSERAGKRVMASISTFIRERLRLQVNEKKSAVARPETRHFLGFRLRPQVGGPTEVLLSERTVKRLRDRIRELTPRRPGVAFDATIRAASGYLKGWLGHFGVATEGTSVLFPARAADAHLRLRLRAIQLRHWKTRRTIVRRIISLKTTAKTAFKRIYEGRKSTWALANAPVVTRALSKNYFAVRGLVSLADSFEGIWRSIAASKRQLTLPWGTRRSSSGQQPGS